MEDRIATANEIIMQLRLSAKRARYYQTGEEALLTSAANLLEVFAEEVELGEVAPVANVATK